MKTIRDVSLPNPEVLKWCGVLPEKIDYSPYFHRDSYVGVDFAGYGLYERFDGKDFIDAIHYERDE